MPTYQYACTDCGKEHEAVQKFSDASLTECPSCGGKLRKVYGAVGVVFKGSGFYKTDSRAANNGAPAAKKEGDASPASEKTSDGGKADGKAEGKAEGKRDAPKADAPKADTSSSKPAPAASPAG